MTLEQLLAKRPIPNAASLPAGQADTLLNLLPGWETTGREIAKTYKFDDFHQTMAFVNAVAWVAHREDHHPDMEVGYNRCRVRYTTHSAGGLSENDFVCAAKVEALGA